MSRSTGKSRNSTSTTSVKAGEPSRVPRSRRTFSSAFRAEAVALMRQRRAEGISLAQIGRELEVRPNLLWEWARKLDGGGTRPAAAPPAPGRLPGETVEEENRRLRRENAILREEREFAKKAAAFFARESR